MYKKLSMLEFNFINYFLKFMKKSCPRKKMMGLMESKNGNGKVAEKNFYLNKIRLLK
jgi:hypothetical protein